MQKLLKILSLLAVGLLLALPAGAAVVPVTGALRNAVGGPATDGSYVLFAALYDAKDAAKPVWQAAYKGVAVQGGTFSLELGDPAVADLPDALWTSGSLLWLGVSVASDPELPRTPLRPSPQAIFAQVAAATTFPYAGSKSMGGAASDLQCSGCVNTDDLADNSVTAVKLSFTYAGSTSKGGPATTAQYADKAGTAATADVAIKANEAAALACTGCIGLAHLDDSVSGAFLSSKGGNLAGDLSVQGNLAVGGATVLNSGLSVAGASSLSGGLDLGNSAVSGGHYAAIDITKVPCAAANAGQVSFDTTTKRLFLCDGSSWLRISVCGGQCKLASQVACGQPVVTDCGDIATCVGTGTLCGAGACVAGACKNVGDSVDLPGKSCQDILAKNSQAKTGTYWIDPLATGAYQVDCDMTTSGGGWVRLLKNAPRWGNQQASAKSLADGTFAAFRAVHDSGYVSCNCGISNQSYPWQGCASAVNDYWSFELLDNGKYVVQQANYYTLPAQCAKPATPTGDIVCTLPWIAKKNDDLTPTWYEPSNNQSLSDNCGQQFIDIWAR